MTSTGDDDSKFVTSVKYYVLNDSNARDFYDEWKFKTMAIIRKKGWSAPFSAGAIIPTDEEVAKAEATAEQKELWKANQEAYDQLLMGCSGIPLGLVRRAHGSASQALKNLDVKYGSKDSSDLTDLLHAFANCKLESTDVDPDKWFIEIDSICEKLSNIDNLYRKKDYEIKAHLLGNLPSGYEDVQTKLSGQEGHLSVMEIEKEICDKWKRSYKDESSKKKDNLAMTVDRTRSKFTKKFKGRCRKCGKQGHKASDCRSDKKGVCFNCGQDGHFSKNCPQKKVVEKGNSNDTSTGMFVGMVEHSSKAATSHATNPTELFPLDSGASCHVIGDGNWLSDPMTSNESVRIGDGTIMRATKRGTQYIRIGHDVLALKNVQVVPGFVKNIISLGKLAEAGNKISITSGSLYIENPSGKVIKVVKDSDTSLFHLKASMAARQEVHPTLIETEHESKITTKEKEGAAKTLIDINDAHELYGHIDHGILRKVLESRGYSVIQNGFNRKQCEACAYAKAKAKRVGKTTEVKATERGERLFLDISGPYKMSLAGSKYWVLIVDDKTRKAWSFFVMNKNGAKKVASNLLSILKGARVITKYLRCDNAGENVKGLRELCQENGIVIELTPPNSPQYNGVVERKFVTLRDRAHAMMLGAHLTEEHQGRLWAEAVYTATRIHNSVPNRHGDAPDSLWYGKPCTLLDHLVQWGRIGYVTIRDKKPNKMTKKSTKMVFLGYANDHAGDVYRFYNPETRRVCESRDVVWAEWHGGQEVPASLKMFANDIKVDLTDDQIIDSDHVLGDSLKPHVIEMDDDELVSAPGAGRKDGGTVTPEANTPAQVPQPARRKERVQRELARLQTYYNPAIVEIDEAPGEEEDRNDEIHYVFNAALSSDPGEPKSIGEALQSKNRLCWIQAIRKEIENFLSRKAWRKVNRTVLAPGQRPISTKWVFKIKNEQDGSVRYKGRLCVRGFVQVPGIDFTLTHSPVATDVSIKILLGITLFFEDKGWDAEMLDIEAAFLEATLDEDVYIDWPEGLVMFGFVDEEETRNTCLKLEKAMYGAVQSPLAFWKENASHLRRMGMIQAKTDPCVWYKIKDNELWLIVAVYVDDIVFSGCKEARQWFKNDVQKRFKITDLGKLKKHLGVWYEKKQSVNGPYYQLTMQKYQTDLLNDWKSRTGREPRRAATPGYPGECLSKNTDGDSVDIEGYRMILGKLMWFCKKIMPECGNAVRELASYMDNPGEAHWRAMERLILGYIANHEPASLILRKPRDLKVYGYVDSNFATNKDNRKSVTGYVLTIGGCLVSFSSKTQPSVTLSSTEAEYVAASTCATEIKFIQMLMEEVVPWETVRPATILEDNTGAIYLMENQAVGNRTKHIDIRMHHIREMMSGEEPRMRVIFTPSELNFADPMTKNVTEAIHGVLIADLKSGGIADRIFETVDREDVNNRNVRRTDRRRSDGPSSDPPRNDCVVSTSVEGHDLESDQWILFQRKNRIQKKAKIQGKGKVGIRGDSKEPG